MTIYEALEYFQSKDYLAHTADVSVSTVRRWIEKREIPIRHQVYIEKKTKGILKATFDAPISSYKNF